MQIYWKLQSYKNVWLDNATICMLLLPLLLFHILNFVSQFMDRIYSTRSISSRFIFLHIFKYIENRIQLFTFIHISSLHLTAPYRTAATLSSFSVDFPLLLRRHTLAHPNLFGISLTLSYSSLEATHGHFSFSVSMHPSGSLIVWCNLLCRLVTRKLCTLHRICLFVCFLLLSWMSLSFVVVVVDVVVVNTNLWVRYKCENFQF